jgi:antitoxin CptB
MAGSETLDAGRSTLDLKRLRWRARRGLLENDLLLSRFLDRHEAQLQPWQVEALMKLLEVPDNQLLDLLLARQPLPEELDTNEVRDVLALLRAA